MLKIKLKQISADNCPNPMALIDLKINGQVVSKDFKKFRDGLSVDEGLDLLIFSNEEITNPLAELGLIPDDIYNKLASTKDLLNPTVIRNLEIRKRFRLLRDQKIKTGDAIETLMKEYPYLQFDSIRKIVHQNILIKKED